MLSEWGTWQPTVWETLVDPKTLAVVEGLLSNNIGDIIAIIQIIGAENAAKCAPHIMNILKTVKAAQVPK